MMQLPSIVARYLAAYNRLDVAGMLACFAEDVVFENVSNAGGCMRIEGKASLGAMAEQSASAFRQRAQSVRRVIADADGIALEIMFTAVVGSDLPNGWKVGQSIQLRGASFFRLRDGLIAELIDLS
jgi:steroid delta-isomerase-like uncharacterized protein